MTTPTDSLAAALAAWERAKAVADDLMPEAIRKRLDEHNALIIQATDAGIGRNDDQAFHEFASRAEGLAIYFSTDIDVLLRQVNTAAAYIAALEARTAELEAWFEQINGNEVVLLQRATVYDYNRHGIVAFQSSEAGLSIFKTLADEGRPVTVMVFPYRKKVAPVQPPDDGEGTVSDNELPYELNPIHVGSGEVIFNPGTGAVGDSSEQHALFNMRQFIQDARLDGLYFRRAADRDYGEGRYAFMVLREGYERVIEIQMPGIALAKVRFTGAADQNIWHFPRLYRDGSSWVWQYAVLDEDDYRTDGDSETGR